MKYKLFTEIEIKAPPEAVWKILTNLDNYKDWNPFIVSSKGKVKVGEKLVNRIAPPNGKAMTFKPIVTVVDENKAFEWLGRAGITGIFDGRHRFELKKTKNGTHFTHSEAFSGLLVGLAKKSLNTKTLKGFEEMNIALKTHAENQTRQKNSFRRHPNTD